ncbi:unnamed protein product [Linum tenue]|uniref:Acyl carrier protein n=1 Tax=Linum tenue TaxID=586396 RepID=A0AAV0RCL0_9ROSI|nr:unnamed protein product [Linum tenue]
MALRAALIRHLRVPVQTLSPAGRVSQPSVANSLFGSIRFMSSHDDHLSKEDVADRVLSVVKSFPKVDPSKFICRCRSNTVR